MVGDDGEEEEKGTRATLETEKDQRDKNGKARAMKNSSLARTHRRVHREAPDKIHKLFIQTKFKCT